MRLCFPLTKVVLILGIFWMIADAFLVESIDANNLLHDFSTFVFAKTHGHKKAKT